MSEILEKVDVTRGPWCVEPNTDEGKTFSFDVRGDAHEGFFLGPLICTVYFVGKHNGCHIVGEEDARKAAQLAAAAPELLALARQYASECGACRGTGLVTVHHRGMDCDDQPCLECADIRAVIAKATGEQS